jgi:hypothetical protein
MAESKSARAAVKHWRKTAIALGLSASKIDRMASAFEHSHA